ncbi:MAG: hypothetical protein BMS9Abin37_2758 [Acidobacteriota bacterium]|nr:MAG: hypothetical protein BMS9Abin37_2758 [Acidobacteriota bacterium]
MSARLLAIALVFFVLTSVFALPLSLHPASEALDLGPDTRLFLWTLGWDVHALVRQPLAIFDANIFYPESRTLAYSEHQIGSALFAAPVIAAGGNPLLAMNLVVLFACALSGIGAFFLGRELGLGWFGALVCGIVFAFTPPRFFRLGQLHLATVQWIPFCLALLHRYARGGKTRHLVGAGLLFTLQAWSGGQSGLFLALSASALGLYLLVLGEVQPKSRLAVDFAGTTLVVLALNIAFLLPYLTVQRELGLERSLQEAIVWSPNAESFIASPSHVDRWALRLLGWEDHVHREAKAYLFPGLLPLVLAIFAFFPRRNGTRAPPRGPLLDPVIAALVLIAIGIELAGGIRIGGFSASGGGRTLVLAIVVLAARFAIYRRAPFTRSAKGYRAWWKAWTGRRIGVAAGFYLWLGAFSLWASLGPPASLYTVLYRVVPGFDFIRVPSRLTLLTVLALAVLAGFGTELVISKRKRWAPVLVVLVLVELAAFPLETTPYEVTTSPMDQWLAERSASEPIVVLPIPDPRDDVASARRHSTYMLYSLAHFAPLVNGYSGFTPQSHERLFQRLARFPDDDGLAELQKLGVRFAVFHRNGYTDREWEELVQRAEALEDGLSLVASFDDGRVYEINRSRRGS